MKNILFIFILLSSLTGFSQEQILNGISLNGPNGFVKAGDLHWNNGNENVMIQYFKGSYADFKGLQSGAKLACEKGSRGSTFVNFLNLEISGKTYGFCLQKGQNTLEIAQTFVYRDGYIYLVIVSAEPNNYQRSFEIMSYMTTRITLF
jgi:hypothetical protein